jgi:hypothetical protein
VEISEATERQLLAHAERQTKALESLVNFALWFTIAPFLGLVILVIWLLAA